MCRVYCAFISVVRLVASASTNAPSTFAAIIMIKAYSFSAVVTGIKSPYAIVPVVANAQYKECTYYYQIGRSSIGS